eukprot:gene46540-41145_t
MASRSSSHVSHAPFNVWQQSQRSHAAAGAAAADAAPPAAEQQSLAHHFSRVATVIGDRKDADTQLRAARDEIERKTRMCADLEYQLQQQKEAAAQLRTRRQARKQQDRETSDAERRKLSGLLQQMRQDMAKVREERDAAV